MIVCHKLWESGRVSLRKPSAGGPPALDAPVSKHHLAVPLALRSRRTKCDLRAEGVWWPRLDSQPKAVASMSDSLRPAIVHLAGAHCDAPLRGSRGPSPTASGCS